MPAETNAYSGQWFEFFHVDIDEARTVKEVAFVCRCAPLPDFHKLADICCGMGRHARVLSSRGYSVTGVDRDLGAIARARELGGGPTYVQADIRDYRPQPNGFDAVIVMSQSFGYFDSPTNRNLLGALARSVRKGGRVILDLWNPEFFANHQGTYEFKTPGGVVRETKHLESDRLSVHLEYPDGGEDRFQWQLFTPEQMNRVARLVGLDLLCSCTGYDIKTFASAENPRIQFVLERCRGV
jgi:SAM-dependent methyltransferase